MKITASLLGVLASACTAFAAPALEAGDEHTYAVELSSTKQINLGMGMERVERVSLEGSFDLLVQEVTARGARVQLVWRTLSAEPGGTVQGIVVGDSMKQAWADAAATLIDQELGMFVLTNGRIAEIEGLTKLSPPASAERAFDRVFAEAGMIALLQGVFMPTGRQAGAPALGLLPCDIERQGAEGKEAQTLTGTASLPVPQDMSMLPGLEQGVGSVTGTLTWNEREDHLEERAFNADAAIDAATGPFKGMIEATCSLKLERK